MFREGSSSSSVRSLLVKLILRNLKHAAMLAGIDYNSPESPVQVRDYVMSCRSHLDLLDKVRGNECLTVI